MHVDRKEKLAGVRNWLDYHTWLPRQLKPIHIQEQVIHEIKNLGIKSLENERGA